MEHVTYPHLLMAKSGRGNKNKNHDGSMAMNVGNPMP
jgi:hypothetical protein